MEKEKKSSARSPRILPKLFQLLVFPIVWILVKIAKNSPDIVETFYSGKLYPVIRNVVSFVTRIFPFSVAEIWIYIFGTVLIITFIIRIISMILIRPKSLIKLISFVLSLAVIFGHGLFSFYFMWGFNYYRQPVSVKLDLPDREYTKEELYSVCLDLSEKTNTLRELVTVNTSGIFCGDLSEMDKHVTEAYASFGASRPSFKANVPKVKHVLASEYLNKRGISGIYIFFTEEPNINVKTPFLYMPYSAAHETAHYLGYAREEDANFIAFLVCRDAQDAAVAYSGYMHALVHCGNALYAADKALYEQLYSTYSEGMKADLADYSDYYNTYAGTEEWNSSNELNDNYLKFNDQEKGVLSYEEDVSLILRYYDSTGFFR